MWQFSGIKQVSFYVVMGLVSLLVLEVGFRAVLAFRVGPSVLYYGTRFQRQNVPAQTDNHTVMQHGNLQQGYTKFFPHELKVDHDPVTNETFRISINSRGFRGGEIDETKKPGVTRIVTLGSSSTFGYYDRDNETYPYYLEQKLNKDSAATGRFEVINLGIPHLHSEEILALFYAEVIPLHPDVVTFYEGVNDAARGNPHVNEGGRKPLPPETETVSDHTVEGWLWDGARPPGCGCLYRQHSAEHDRRADVQPRTG